MEYLYLVCLIISIGMLLWLKIFDVRNSVIQYINLLIIVVANLGFYFQSTSTSLEELIITQKITYIAGIFLPICYFFLVLEICHISINRIVSIILMAIQCVIYGFVCTIGKSDIFYKSASLETLNGNVVLNREYGPAHIFYLVTMYFYLVASITVIIVSIIRNRTVNRRGTIAMAVLSAVAVGAYAVQRAIGLPFDITPIAYDALMIGALIPVYKSNLFTVYEKKDIIEEQFEKIGFLTFDKNRVYQDANKAMKAIFPELANYRVGQKIKNCSGELQMLIDQIVSLEEHLQHHKHTQSKNEHAHDKLDGFWLDGKYYEGMIHVVTNAFGFLKGYTIELNDKTASQMIIELKEKYNEELAKDVDEKTEKIRFIQQKIILGMAQMVESRDLSTGGHIKRTSDVVKIFAKKLMEVNFGLDKKFLKLVIRSAPMHDLGKIGVDDAILRKQGKFTDEEYAVMKNHSEIGYHIVKDVLDGVEEEDFVRVAENVAHYHHEKVNGMGYPHGLKGDEIPIEARIMALADVFDALVSKRCYKEAFSYDRAFEIIKNDSGSHFDAKLAEVFITCRPELEEYYNSEA